MNDFPFNYFLTKKNISLSKIKNIPNISNITKITTKESLLIEYKNEIEEYIKKNNLKISDIEKFKYLENIDNYFKTLLTTKNIENFISIIISSKNNISEINKNIEVFSKLRQNVNRNKNIKYNSKLIYHNPIKYEDINIDVKTFFKKYESNLLLNNNDLTKIKKMIDILSSGDLINLSLPSIGLLRTNIAIKEDDLIYTLTDFMSDLMNLDNNDKNQNFILPIEEIDIEHKISELLLDVKLQNLKINFNSGNFNYYDPEKSKNLIINSIKNIKIKVIEIFIESKKINNKRLEQKINSMYLIPYTYDTTIDNIRLLKKNEIESKLRNYENFMSHNNETIKHVIGKIFEEDNGIEYLEKENYKNVLASFLFIVIQMFYNIYYIYFEKIVNVIKELIDEKEKRFGLLNIEYALNYVTSLKKSLFIFKKILLNNFYNLFLPSKISKNSYGMKKYEFNCFIPESNFLNNNSDIYNKYPFTKFDIKHNHNRISNFISIITNKYDIYEKGDILEFGGNAFQKNIMDNSFKFLIEYYKICEKSNKFTLFIIDKIINYFIENKNIPYELLNLESIENKINNFSNNLSQSFIEKNLLSNFDYSYEKFKDFYIKYLYLISKIKYISKPDVKIFTIKLIFEYCYKIYQNRARAIYLISDKNIIDTKRKNQLIVKITEKIVYYNKMIEDEQKKINKSERK
jgi:hypothetical protein